MSFSKKEILKARDAFCLYDHIGTEDDLYRFIPGAFSDYPLVAEGPPGTGKSKVLHAIAFTYSYLKTTPSPVFLTLTTNSAEGDDLYFKVKKAVDAAAGGKVKRVSFRSVFATLSPASFLLVDEAGLIPLPLMKRLLDAARKCRCPVALCGDLFQILPSKVKSGLPFALDQAKTVIRFNKIFRQEDAAHKKATLLLRDGKVKQALSIYQKLGCFHFYDDTRTLLADLKKDFSEAAPDPRARVRVVLTPSLADKKIVKASELPVERIADVQGISQLSAFVALLKRQSIPLPVLLVLLSRHKRFLKIYVAKSAFSDINDLCLNIRTAS